MCHKHELPASFDSKSWDDLVYVEPEFSHEVEDVRSTWIQPIKSLIVLDSWNYYSYWLQKDDSFCLVNRPSFTEENWDESSCLKSNLESVSEPEAQDVNLGKLDPA